MNLLYTYPETIVDGDGIRYSIYLAGCSHHCPGCHNPESWDPCAGTPLTDEVLGRLIEEMKANPLLDGVTFSGGDPFFHPVELLGVIRRVKQETGLNVWCYTGFTLEQLLEQPDRAAVLPYIDVLVDGRFVRELYSPYLEFRGSSNQRIIPHPGGVCPGTQRQEGGDSREALRRAAVAALSASGDETL